MENPGNILLTSRNPPKHFYQCKYIIYCNGDNLKVISYNWPLSQHIIQDVSCATYRCGHQSILTSALLRFSVYHQMMTKNAERKKFAGKNMPLLLSNYRNKCLCLWMYNCRRRKWNEDKKPYLHTTMQKKQPIQNLWNEKNKKTRQIIVQCLPLQLLLVLWQ